MPSSSRYEDWGFLFHTQHVKYKNEMQAWCQLMYGKPFDQWLISTGGDRASPGDPVIFWFKNYDQLTQFILTWVE